MSCVYKHTFPNGAVYIGKTSMLPEDRWLNGWGYRNCPLMFNAILQYGWNNVKHEILVDNISDEEATEIERKEIALHSVSTVTPSDTVSTEQPPTMIYNMDSLPPQYLAQENTHFLPTDTTTQLPRRHKAVRYTETVPQYKDYVVPLVPKPLGTHQCPVDVYTVEGNFICTYPSGKIAALELGVNHGDVVSCCKGVKADGRRKYQVNGYIFRYHIEKEVG